MQVDYAKTDSTGNYVLIQYKPANSTGLALKKGYVNTKHVLGGNPEMVKQQWLEDKGFEYEYQDKGNAPIFSGTPTQSQVRQGFLGDCYLVATISAIVQNNHRHITNMMNDLGDAVRVRFFLNDNPVYVTVDKQVPSFAGSKSYTHRSGAIFTQPYVRGSLWASLLEKAYAVFTGQTYAQLESGGKSHEVLKHMVNISATERSPAATAYSTQRICWTASHCSGVEHWVQVCMMVSMPALTKWVTIVSLSMQLMRMAWWRSLWY
ncbi:MAG: C2 family cysteine protease [Chloroflexota bacterium]